MGERPMAAHDDSHTQEVALAFAAWWRRWVGRATHALGSRDDAEDAVSSAFVRALERRQTYDPARAPVAAWLTAIVRNEITDRQRARTRSPSVALDSDAHADDAESIEAAVERREEWAQLAAALAHLPERDAQIIALRFGQGLSNCEIARLLDAKEHTVSVWVLRAVRRLRTMLEEEPTHAHE